MKKWISVLVMMTAGLASAQVPGFFTSVNATGDYSNSNGTLIPYTSPGLGFGVSQPPVGPGLSIAAWCQSVVCNAYSAFGDSNTQGAHATGVICLTGNTGTCYPDVIAQKLNALGGGISVMGNVTNYGLGGTGLNSAQNQIVNNWVEDVGSRRLGTVMIGSNDTGFIGTGQGVTTLSKPGVPEWNAEFTAMDQWAAVPFSNKQAAGSGTLGSGWGTDSTYTSMVGATSTTNGSVLTLPVMTIPQMSSSVVLYYEVMNGNGGTFSWQLINSSTSAVYTSGTGINAPTNGVTIYSPTSNFTYALHTITIPGWSTGPPVGSYYFKITVSSATSSSNVVTILGSGFGPSYNNTNYQTASPQFWVFNVPLQSNGIFRGGLATISSNLKGDVYNDQILGFPINFYDDWNWVHGTFPEYGGKANYIHLSVLGSAELAAGALTSTGMPPTSGIPGITYNDPTILNSTLGGVQSLATTINGEASPYSMVDPQGNTVWSNVTSGTMITGDTLVIAGNLGVNGTATAAATFRGAGGGGSGHTSIIEDFYYNTGTSTVQTSSWQQTDSSNTGVTVTPTQINRTWNCAGTCLPYGDNFTYPVASTLAYNGLTYFRLATNAAATSSANVQSPFSSWNGQYWNGSSSSTDIWTLTPTLGSGSNPTSTLAFAHTGSSGTANVTMPSLTVSGTSRGGTITDGTCSISGGTLTGCATAGATSRTCNANGCYKIDADGTVRMWGIATGPTSGSGVGSITGSFSLPFTCPTVAPTMTIAVGTNPAGSGSGNDNDTPPSIGYTAISTSGASYFAARVVQASAGGGNFAVAWNIDWTATCY